MKTINVEELKERLDDLLEEVVGGEEIIIKTDEIHQIKMISLPTKQKKGFRGCAKGLIHIRPDFDEPLNDLKEYV